MKRKIIVLLIALLLITGITGFAEEKTETVNDELSGQLDQLNLGEWESYIKQLEKNEILNNYGIKDFILKVATGEADYSDAKFYSVIIDIFVTNLSSLMFLIIQLFALGILCGMIEKSKATFSATDVNEIASFIITALALTVIVVNLSNSIKLCADTLGTIAGFSQIVMTVLLPILVSAGGTATAGVFQPTSVMLSSIISSLLRDVLLPAITISGVFALVNTVSERTGLKGLSELIKNIHNWLLGTVFVVFSGFLTLKGISASGIDGISIRAVKYTVGNSLPVIGGVFSDSIDLVLSCTLILKNAAGIAGIVCIFLIVISPIIELFTLSLALKIAAAAVEPLGAAKIAAMSKAASGIAVSLCLLVVAATVLLILVLALIINVGNVSNWVR